MVTLILLLSVLVSFEAAMAQSTVFFNGEENSFDISLTNYGYIDYKKTITAESSFVLGKY